MSFANITDVRRTGGPGISIELKIQKVATGLGKFSAAYLDFSVPNRQIGIQFYGWVMRNFNASGLNQSPPWRPLAEKTAKRKAKEGYSSKPLIRKGNLRNSFAPFSDKNVAGVGARASFGVDYAKIHQEGGAKIPQRDMLPPRPYAIDSATKIYQLHLETSRRKGGV